MKNEAETGTLSSGNGLWSKGVGVRDKKKKKRKRGEEVRERARESDMATADIRRSPTLFAVSTDPLSFRSLDAVSSPRGRAAWRQLSWRAEGDYASSFRLEGRALSKRCKQHSNRGGVPCQERGQETCQVACLPCRRPKPATCDSGVEREAGRWGPAC